MTLRGHKVEIDIIVQTGESTRTVKATVFPPLAIHKKAWASGQGYNRWTISHVPTGLRICDTKTRKHARLLVSLFLSLDWRRMEPEQKCTDDERRVLGDSVRRIIQDNSEKR